MENKGKLKSHKLLKFTTACLAGCTILFGAQTAYYQYKCNQEYKELPAEVEALRETQGYNEFIDGYKDYTYKKYKKGEISAIDLSKKLENAYNNDELLKNYARSLDDIDITKSMIDDLLADNQTTLDSIKSTLYFILSGMGTVVSSSIYNRKLQKEHDSEEENTL